MNDCPRQNPAYRETQITGRRVMVTNWPPKPAEMGSIPSRPAGNTAKGAAAVWSGGVGSSILPFPTTVFGSVSIRQKRTSWGRSKAW